MSNPVFWFSSDGKRIINIVAVCNAFLQGDGSWYVSTIDCDQASLHVRAQDAASFISAIREYRTLGGAS